MARYKDYINPKDDRNGSVFMYAYRDDKRWMYFQYDVVIEPWSDNEQRVHFGEDKDSAEKYMKKLGFKEYYFKNGEIHYKR